MSLKNTSLFGVILALLLTFGVGEMWGVKYYAGSTNSWGADAMTVSADGLYEYIRLNKQSGTIQFKIRESNQNWNTTYDRDKTASGFNRTDVTNMNNGTTAWGENTGDAWMNICIYYVDNPFYILFYYPNTTLNSSNSPKICAATCLPDNRAITAYFVNSESWNGTIYAFGWYHQDNINGGNNANWPGEATTNTSKTYNGKAIYSYEYQQRYEMAVFNNNSSQTADLNFGLANAGKMWNGSNWVTLAYDVTLNQQSGSGGTSSIIATCGSAMPGSKTAPTRAGYTFGGYYTSTGGGGTQYYTSSMTSARNWPSDGSGPTTLYAKWTENTFDVTTTKTPSSGGSVTPTTWTAMGVVSGGDITATPNTGYTFGGWSVLSGSGYFGASGTSTTTATANTKFRPTSNNTTIKATFTAKTYAITLNGNGGSDGSATATYNSSSLSDVVACARAGYTLNGYFTATSGGTKIINADGTLVSGTIAGYLSSGNWVKDGNATLYAQWTENSVYYTLHFTHGTSYVGLVDVSAEKTSDDSDISDNSSLLSGTGVRVTAEPAAHYKFVGWYSNAGCTSLVSSDNPYTFSISANTNLYAKVQQMTTVITLNANGGSGGTASVTATHGSRDLSSAITKPTRAGYTLSGWYTAESGGTRVILATGYTAGSVSGYTDASGNWIYTESALTLYAHWTEQKKTLTPTVSYDHGSSDYTATSANTLGVVTTSELTASTPNAAHYTFAGWTLTNLIVTSGDKDNDLSITVKVDNPASACSAVANYAEVLTSSWYINSDNNSPFTGWATAGNRMSKKSGHSTEEIYSCTLNITDPRDYSIKMYNDAGTGNKYYQDKGNSGKSKSIDVGSCNGVAFALDNANDKPNMTFKAYIAGEYEFKLDNTGASPTLTITWPEINQLRVSNASPANAENVGNFDLSAPVSNVRSATRSLAANTTYTFKIVYNSDWYGFNSGTFTRSTSTSSNSRTLSTSGGDMTLTTDYAGDYTFKFNQSTKAFSVDFPAAYKLTFGKGSVNGTSGSFSAVNLDNGNSAVTSNSTWVKSGHRVKITAPSAKTGYRFLGWYDNNGGTGAAITTNANCTITVASAQTVYACYAENLSAITITTDGHGTITTPSPNSSPYNLGVATTQAINATPNTGYNWSTWTISGNAALGSSATTASNTAKGNGTNGGSGTITATFTPKTTTITLNNQDATTPGTTEVTATYDAAMPAITLPEKTGYTFGGYWGAPGGGAQQFYDEDGSSVRNWNNENATYTLFAKWTANGYTVTIDVDEENKGTIASATTSQSVTYGAALTTIPDLPTAADGYGLDGYYTDHNGVGTKVINGDGTWIASVDGYTDADTKWIHAGDATLYAYYKQAEITELTLAETIVGTAETDSITVTPVIAPLPSGTTIVCLEVQYSNGNALSPQPAGRLVSGNTYRFKAPTASATYKIEATLRSGAVCGGGSVLSTRVATFQVAGEHTVTVLYKCDDLTLAASSEVNARPLEWSDEIVAPDITGYTFSGWVAGDGVTIKDGESSTATTHIKAVYDGTLTANYTKKRLIYFNNTLNWANVYVYFYKNNSYWEGTGEKRGSGADPTYTWDNTPYSERLHGTMTQIDGTNIYYFDAEAAEVNESYTTVAFTKDDQDGYGYFHETDVVRRDDYKSTTLPMFVPIAEQTPEKYNETNYYFKGYWMNYPENTGYTLKIYNQKATAGAVELRSVPFAYSADLIMPLEVKVDLEAGRTYGFKIYRADGTTYGNIGTMTANTPNWEMTSDAASNCGLTTTAAGDYTFNLYYSDYNEDRDYQYRVDVTYPVAANDYRIVYSDLAAWSGATHTAAWIHPSRVITKNNGSEAKQDTVSFFWAYGSSPALKYQTCTEVGTGSATWSAGTAISVSSFSSVLTKTGVYNFIFEQPAGGASISLIKVEPYNGKYYIRTDCAGATKWANYRTIDHEMTYSDYAETNSGFSHYFAHWVTSGTNVKFTIANDYSPCVSDTLTADYGTVVANINAGGDLVSGNANIRYMWNQSDNKLSRAYISGSGNISDRFLVLEGDAKMYDENGNALTTAGGGKISGLNDNEMNLIDDENFVYERTIQVNTTARAKLTAKYNNNVQYFIGGASETVELLGGAASDTKYTMRIVYDFKTNRLVTAYMPSDAAITENLAINADIMLVREHQNAGQQLTFDGGSLSKVKTVYGVMRFNRWTLNNKEKTGEHSPVGDPKSTYERSLYWISFPFDVNLSDVFGFGTYGTHWIIEYYDGAERATEGYWKDSEGFWKYITNRRGVTLKAGKGYILALDLDLMRDNNETFWAHEIQQVELFFPSAAAVENIEKTDTEIDIPAHECTIAPRPGQTDDRRKKDSHWNIIGVPSYANYGTELKNGNNETITWNDDPETKDLPFLYEWNTVDNSYSVQSGTTYPFKSMHAYMVQYFGKIKWSLASATPSPVVARHADAPQDVEFRLELQAGEKVADQTFVKMTTDKQISTAFDFNYDLSKQMNSGKANIYTMVEGYIQTAGNCLPMTEQTTVVPVGVKIAADGDYTFAIPDGTEGVGVTLIDQETGIRTSLSALAYTVTLEAGTYDERFVLEISPIHNVPTEQSAVSDQQTDVRKVLIDGLLYIVRDNKMYDARGAMVMEK